MIERVIAIRFHLVVGSGLEARLKSDPVGRNLILDFDEPDDGGSNNRTGSMYAVSFGPDRCHGIENGGIDTRHLGELDSKPVERMRVKWFASWLAKHPRAISRLRHIKKPA